MRLSRNFQSKRGKNKFLLEGDASVSLNWDNLSQRKGSNATFLLFRPGKHSQLPKQSKCKESEMELCISQTGFSGSGLSQSFSLHVASQSVSVCLFHYDFFRFNFFIIGGYFFARVISLISFPWSPSDNVLRYLRWGVTSGWMSPHRRGCWELS